MDSGDDKYEKVGQKKPNPWGLYDILGNLMEWTMDHYDPERYSKIADNEKNPVTEVNSAKYPKSLRGGSFMESGTAFRSAKRFHSEPAWNRRDPQIPKSKWWLTEAKMWASVWCVHKWLLLRKQSMNFLKITWVYKLKTTQLCLRILLSMNHVENS